MGYEPSDRVSLQNSKCLIAINVILYHKVVYMLYCIVLNSVPFRLPVCVFKCLNKIQVPVRKQTPVDLNLFKNQVYLPKH